MCYITWHTPVCNKVVLPARSSFLALQDCAHNVVQVPGRALLCCLQRDLQGCGGLKAGTFHSEAVHLSTGDMQGHNQSLCVFTLVEPSRPRQTQDGSSAVSQLRCDAP